MDLDRDAQRPDSERSSGQKSPDAFRTISEVSTDLDIPQHVLRFWEGKFTQIRPLKRAGGRRYYRPDDVELLRGIQHLLYGDGYTIKGVQKILREQGIKFVVAAGRREGDAEPDRRPPPALDEVGDEPISAAEDLEPESAFEDGVKEPEADEEPHSAAPAEPDDVPSSAESDTPELAPTRDEEPTVLLADQGRAAAPEEGWDEGDDVDDEIELEAAEANVEAEIEAEPEDELEPVQSFSEASANFREPDERGRIEPTFDPLPAKVRWEPEDEALEDDAAAMDREEVDDDLSVDDDRQDGQVLAVADEPSLEAPDADPPEQGLAPERLELARRVLMELEDLRSDYHRRLSAIRRS